MTRDTFGMEAKHLLDNPGLLTRMVSRLLPPEQKPLFFGVTVERDELRLTTIVRILMLFRGPEGFYTSDGGVEIAEFANDYNVSTIIQRVLKRVEILIKDAGIC